MRDICYCICPLISTIVIFCNAHGMPCATSVLNNKLRNNFYGNIFSVSNEISPILVTRFLFNESRNVPKKNFWQSVQKHRREREKEEKKEG